MYSFLIIQFDQEILLSEDKKEMRYWKYQENVVIESSHVIFCFVIPFHSNAGEIEETKLCFVIKIEEVTKLGQYLFF